MVDVKPLLRLLDGDLSKLNLTETTDAITLAKQGKLIDSDTYTSFKSSKGNSTLSSFLVSQELDNIKRSGNYDLLDTDHTILGDFNPNGTFKSGGHYYEVMDNYIKKGLVEAFADRNGTIRITDITQITPNEIGVRSLYVREYKPGRIEMTSKSVTPSSMSLEKFLGYGNKIIEDGRPIANQANQYYDLIEIDGYIAELNARFSQNLRTWYFTSELVPL